MSIAVHGASGYLPLQTQAQSPSVNAESSDQKAQSRDAESNSAVPNAEASDDAQLRAIDQRVRAHERAHASVGGQYASPPSFEYVKGSNGVLYAVAGEVQIDVAEIPGDPRATLEKMQTVQAAALAPSDPSAADRQIAAAARQKSLQAQAELGQLRTSAEEPALLGSRLDVRA